MIGAQKNGLMDVSRENHMCEVLEKERGMLKLTVWTSVSKTFHSV